VTDYPHARLAVLRRSGDKIYFRIGDADDFYSTLNEFKARVPARARRYYPDRHEWRVDARYENVLADLFDNYDASADVTKKRARMTTYASRGRQTRSPSTSAIKLVRFAFLIGIVIVAGLWLSGRFGASSDSLPTAQATTAYATPSPTHTSVPTAAPAVLLETLTPARVARVVDGDTIDVIMNGRRYRLRYIGMDTPERDEEGFSAATQRNRQLLGNGVIYLEKDISETGPYGRLLRYVYLPDGRMVNEILVEEGWARAATYPPDVKYADRFRAAERSARKAGVGLWEP
jgi:endonuclease YncB( thermonuclease family)